MLNDKETQALIQDLSARADENSWNYSMESYPKDSKLCMLVLDTYPLWKWGGAAIPTLAWMAEEHGSLFDSYWPYFRDPGMYNRMFFKCHAMEQCYLLSLYFHVTWHIIGDDGKAMLHPIQDFDTTFSHDSYLTLYKHYMQEHNIKCNTAVVIPGHHRFDQPSFVTGQFVKFRSNVPRKYYVPENGGPKDVKYPIGSGRDIFAHPLERGYGKTQFYLWPDIYFRKALGFIDDVAPEQLKQFGIKKVLCVLCNAERFREAGFEVEVIDSDQLDDSQWSITKRCFDRWPGKAEGICYGMWQADKTHPGWLGYMIRNRYFCLYDRRIWSHLPKAVEVAHELGNRNIMGTGDDWMHPYWIDLLPATQAGWLFQPTEAGTPSIKRGMRLKCPKPSITPWDVEVSDEFLMECAGNGKIGVCVVCIVTDMAYLNMYPGVMDDLVAWESKAGFAYCLPWVEYFSEWMQKMFTKTYAPYIEPLLGEVGPSWFFTMKHPGEPTMHLGAFKKQALFTLEKIGELMGPDYLPRGFASGFRDRWEHTQAYIVPLAECGLNYYFAGRSPTMEYEARDGIIAISLFHDQLPRHYPKTELCSDRRDCGADHQMEALKIFEKAHEGPGFCALAPDSGGFKSSYFRRHVFEYIARGGDTERLLPLKPSEIVRYATIIEQMKTGNNE